MYTSIHSVHLAKKCPSKYTSSLIESKMKNHKVMYMDYPQQNNSCDCGLFACYGIAKFYETESFNFDFDQDDIYKFRDQLKQMYKTLFTVV